MTKYETTLAEIGRAKELFAAYGQRLGDDERLGEMLAAYQREIAATWRTFAGSRVVELCAACAGADQISCCFDGAEYWFDRHLLLINLMMGVELPTERWAEGQCLFVGPDGCRLKARFAICINFFCPDLRQRIGSQELLRLRRQGGREVLAGLELEEALRRWLAQNAG